MIQYSEIHKIMKSKFLLFTLKGISIGLILYSLQQIVKYKFNPIIWLILTTCLLFLIIDYLVKNSK